jgi:hypothetical protein
MTTSRTVKRLVIGFGALVLAMLAICMVASKLRAGRKK